MSVAASGEATYKITLTPELFNKLKEKQIYQVKINYISPYKVTKNITTITVKKEEPGIWSKIKSMSLGNAKDLGIDYSKVNSSTNGEGVYLFDETKNDNYPVYFFRGTHKVNNNLLYANFCWKIVRTTENRGVRIVYNGKPVNGKCTNTTGDATQIGKDKFNLFSDKEKYIGYMYGSDTSPYQNTNESNIKKYIDNWYKTNIKDKGFDGKVDNQAIYCGDRRKGTNQYTGTNYAGRDRIEKGQPAMKCPSDDSYGVDAGNKKLTYPVGLLSVDEINLSGAVWSRSHDNNYLYTDNNYWLITPSIWYKTYTVNILQVTSNGGVKDAHPDFIAGGIRPAITIKGDSTIFYGDGSKDKPFVMTTTLEGRVKADSLGTDKDNNIDYQKGGSGTNGEGVYIFDETKNDSHPVYFYRGSNALKNNLLYANFCWKMVRTTETGGVKVLYNGTPIDGKCTNTTEDSKIIGKSRFNLKRDKKQHIGYMYGDDANPYQNINDSDIKKYIDNWYKTNIKDKGFESHLDKGSIYCGDRTEGSLKSGWQYYAGYDRSEQNKPTLKCPSNDSYGVESGNRKLIYPVGLLSADEINLSGAKKTTNNYLLTKQPYWTLSPHRWNDAGNPAVLLINKSGYLRGSIVSNSSGVRPIITIATSVLILSGDGSPEQPYII